MIVTELYLGQGLGNQLWNYVVARVLAKKRSCDFAILGQEKFKGHEFMEIDFGVPLSGGRSPEGGPPDQLPDGITNYYRERKENYLGTTADISRTDPGLLAIPLNTKFDGNGQSTKYIQGYRPNILEWLKVKPSTPSKPLDEHTCVIHLRCGDFANLKDVFLPPQYYQNAMAHIKKIDPQVKFYCVTDQADVAAKILPAVEIVGSALLPQEDAHKASHHFGGPVGIDFTLLQNATYLILSNSSFSWWAAYLNTKKKLAIAPKYWAEFNKSDGYWSTSDIITDDLTYLDRNGAFFTPKECWTEKDAYEQAHPEIFTPPPAPLAGKSPQPSLITRAHHAVLQTIRKIRKQ